MARFELLKVTRGRGWRPGYSGDAASHIGVLVIVAVAANPRDLGQVAAQHEAIAMLVDPACPV